MKLAVIWSVSDKAVIYGWVPGSGAGLGGVLLYGQQAKLAKCTKLNSPELETLKQLQLLEEIMFCIPNGISYWQVATSILPSDTCLPKCLERN